MGVTSLRLFLHVLAGGTWVAVSGAILWTTLRESSRDSSITDDVRQTLASVSAVALVIVVATGIWSVFEVGPTASDDAYGGALLVKLLAAFMSFAAVGFYRGAETRGARVRRAVVLVVGALWLFT